MSISCTALSALDATMANTLSPVTNVLTPCGFCSATKPTTPSSALPTAAGAAGSEAETETEEPAAVSTDAGEESEAEAATEAESN